MNWKIVHILQEKLGGKAQKSLPVPIVYHLHITTSWIFLLQCIFDAHSNHIHYPMHCICKWVFFLSTRTLQVLNLAKILHEGSYTFCILHFAFCILHFAFCIVLANEVFLSTRTLQKLNLFKILHGGSKSILPTPEFWSVSVWNLFQKWRMLIKVKHRCHMWRLKYGPIHESYMLPKYFEFYDKNFITFKLYCW